MCGPHIVHSLDYVLASITGASMASSSANMSANENGEGGLFLTSFPSILIEKDAKTVVTHFSAGSSTRATQAGNHSLNVGQARNYLVARFVISLTKGETIQGRKIRHATMRNYVKAISTLYTDRNMETPYCADVDSITMVLKAVRKYKIMKHQRTMIHDKMAHLMEATRAS